MSTVTTEIREHVFLIGLNRPDKYNAFNLAMLREQSAAYAAFEADPELRCAVLFAHGKNFTAGLDLAEVGPAVAKGEALYPLDAIDPLGLEPSRRRSKPVIIAVQGWCLTIGIELLLACDFAVAARDTRFGQIEINRGIMPFGGATIRMPRLCGWGNAMRYLLTGDKFDAAEAHRIGLVQELVEPGQQLERAIELAQTIASRAPLGVQATLRSAWCSEEQGPEAATAELLVEARKLMDSEDAREGLLSFVERREARFKGR